VNRYCWKLGDGADGSGGDGQKGKTAKRSHFGTGVLARQIAESGLEIGQTPERLGEAL